MEFQKDGRFSFSEIHRYLSAGIYPDDFSKPDKQALRKRAKFFRAKNTALYYVGGHKGDSEPSTERLVVEDHEQRKRIIASVHDSCHLGVQRWLL